MLCRQKFTSYSTASIKNEAEGLVMMAALILRDLLLLGVDSAVLGEPMD